MELHTHTSGGAHYSVLVAAQGDLGYTVSSLIIGEAALGLALDRDRLPRAVGVLTPATALGTLLVARLKAAGVTMKTRRNEPDAPGPTVESDASAADELWPVQKATRYRDAFESKGCQIRRVQTAERQRTSGRSKLFS